MDNTILGKSLNYWKEKKCATKGCYNYSMMIYIYCEKCMYGPGCRLPDEVIVAIKKSEGDL